MHTVVRQRYHLYSLYVQYLAIYLCILVACSYSSWAFAATLAYSFAGTHDMINTCIYVYYVAMYTSICVHRNLTIIYVHCTDQNYMSQCTVEQFQ